MINYKNGITIYDEDLPKHILKGRECIWWEQAVGRNVRVQYNTTQKMIVLTKYYRRKISYKLQDIDAAEFTTDINTFICHGGILKNVFPEYMSVKYDWKYSVGEILQGKLHKVKIINREKRPKDRYKRNEKYVSNEKWYQAQCCDCGYDQIWFREDRPLKWIGCQCCRGQALVVGKNDLGTTNPEILKVLTRPVEAFQHTKGEHIWLNTTCPICGHQKDVYAINLALGKYTCENCSDGISYPEKFLMDLFNQLDLNYNYQLSRTQIPWCGKYRYDFLLSSRNTIVEAHGMQHYQDTNKSKCIDVQANDQIKYNLAMQNGISQYIVIDARYSDKEYIKQSILDSPLADLFDLKVIDWERCETNAQKSYVAYICDQWNKGASVPQIADELQLSTACIQSYLRKFKETGLVQNYTTGESRKRSLIYQKEKRHAA